MYVYKYTYIYISSSLQKQKILGRWAHEPEVSGLRTLNPGLLYSVAFASCCLGTKLEAASEAGLQVGVGGFASWTPKGSQNDRL